jgi:phage gpG-like protein
MSKISVKIDGIDDLLADLKRLGTISDELLVEALNDVADDTQQFAVDGIKRGPASGRPRGDGSSASAPGEYPMSDTGRLMGNIETIEATPSKIEAKVGTNIIYGAHLEFGTSRMAARPWLMPSFRKASEGVAKELKAKLEGRL